MINVITIIWLCLQENALLSSKNQCITFDDYITYSYARCIIGITFLKFSYSSCASSFINNFTYDIQWIDTLKVTPFSANNGYFWSRGVLLICCLDGKSAKTEKKTVESESGASNDIPVPAPPPPPPPPTHIDMKTSLYLRLTLVIKKNDIFSKNFHYFASFPSQALGC